MPNTTNQTRVSIDFRCVMGEDFDRTNRLARRGYFAEARLGSDESYVKVDDGCISELHGLPHCKRAKVGSDG